MTRNQLYTIYDKALLFVVLAFFCAHILNHMTIAIGVDTHIQIMENLRIIYRNPVIEFILIFAIARQCWAGIKQTRRFGVLKPKKEIRMLVWSGIYLIFFLVIHISAVTFARWGQGIDTNLYFGVAGFREWPFSVFFFLYYFTAIFCAFAHSGAVIWIRQRSSNPVLASKIYKGFLALALIKATLLTLWLSGTINNFEVPSAYLAPFQSK